MPASQFVYFNTYQRIAASKLDLMQNTFTAFKLASESVVSSTTLQPDNDLLIPASYLVADASYFFRGFIYYQGGAQGSSDINCQLNVPSGSVFNGVASYNSSAGAQEAAFPWAAGTPQYAGSNGAGQDRGIVWRGSLLMGSSLGNGVYLSWAQHTSSTTATIVLMGSSLMLTRLS
jgi:hypothetical protein